MNDIRDFMVTEPILCTPLTSIDNIKQLMAANAMEEILVVDTLLEKHLVGRIREEDISSKATDQSVEPSSLNAEQCMRPVSVTARETFSLEECQKLMEAHRLDSLAIIDEEGHVCGVYGAPKTSGAPES